MGEFPSSGAIGAIRAQELLGEVATLRRRVRRPAGLWPPLVIFGAAAVLGAPLGMLGGLAISLWWLAIAPPGFALVSRHAARQAHRRGIDGPGRLLRALGIASFAVAWLACLALAAAAHLPHGLGWTLTVAIGYLGWSCFARSGPAAAVAISLAAVGAALALSPAPAWTVQLGVGMTMVAGGLLLRRGPEAR